MDPALFAEFCDEFTREMNRLRLEGRASIDSAEAETKKIDRDLDMLVELILKGGQADRHNEKMLVLEKRQKTLKEFLATADTPPPLLHPEMATYYRSPVAELYAALKAEPKNQQMAVTEALRTLTSRLTAKNPPKRRDRWWLGLPAFPTCDNRKLRWLRESASLTTCSFHRHLLSPKL
jgi:site-specific DNA recombinase